MSKTDTIKKRRVDIYLPSLEAKERWTKLADEAGMSLSKFIPQLVEDVLNEREAGPDLSDLQDTIEMLQAELKESKEKARMLEALRDKQDEALRRYRAEAYLESRAKGIETTESGLVELLKGTTTRGKPRTYKADQILRLLEIKPSEEEAVKAIHFQLETLVDFGVVDYSPAGYTWRR